MLHTRSIVGTTSFTKYGVRSLSPQLRAPRADECENDTRVAVPSCSITGGWGQITIQAERKGIALATADGLIAATAIEHGLDAIVVLIAAIHPAATELSTFPASAVSCANSV
jgi:hypothetical protein